MQIRNRFYIASMILAAFVLTGSLVRADDTTQQTVSPKKVATVKKDETSKKQVAAAKEADKNAKAVSDSASKLDLSTPVSNVKFYGVATVGYEASFGKTVCAGKNARQDGMFSQLQFGTDIRLTKDVTMSVQVVAGQYPNGFGLR